MTNVMAMTFFLSKSSVEYILFLKIIKLGNVFISVSALPKIFLLISFHKNGDIKVFRM